MARRKAKRKRKRAARRLADIAPAASFGAPAVPTDDTMLPAPAFPPSVGQPALPASGVRPWAGEQAQSPHTMPPMPTDAWHPASSFFRDRSMRAYSDRLGPYAKEEYGGTFIMRLPLVERNDFLKYMNAVGIPISAVSKVEYARWVEAGRPPGTRSSR